MKLSVVILNYNVRYFLELCLRSVQASLDGINSEIIVIDNDSTDESCTMVKNKFPNVRLIENKQNVGFSKANNQAVLQAKGEYVCILNPDVVLTENTLKNLLNFSESKSNVGVVGCRLIDGSGLFLPESKRNFPKISVSIQKFIGIGTKYYANQIAELDSKPVDVIPGALMFLRRSLYNELSGFDEDFFMYGEDIDLSYRVQKLGYLNYYLGNTTVIHFKGESTAKSKIQSQRFYNAMRLFYKKHFNTNIFTSALISITATLAPYFSNPKQPKKRIPKKVAFIKPFSNQKWLNIKESIAISADYALSPTSHYDIIFDTECVSFEYVISQIDSSENKFISYKIRPIKTNYFVGSDTSKQRGEVIHFDEFESVIYF